MARTGYTLCVTKRRTENDFLPIRAKDLWLPPNMVSISRILITPFVGYYLAVDTPSATVVCVALLIVAAITDALDGYLARRFDMRTGLGLVLDPLADKLFAGVLLIELVAFRDLPVWLAAGIIGRDIIIVVAGLLILGRRKVSTPSNIIGQYTFSAIVLLLGFYIIRFQFGIQLFMCLVVLLILLSLGSYGLRFARILQSKPIAPSNERPLFKLLRVVVTAVILTMCAVMLVLEKWN